MVMRRLRKIIWRRVGVAMAIAPVVLIVVIMIITMIVLTPEIAYTVGFILVWYGIAIHLMRK